MKFLQKLGKALMLPVAILPICGILMGIGYRLCPATMQGGDIQGAVNLIGLFLVKAGGALIDNMAILFAIGVGVGMSEKNDGTGGIAALASWLNCIRKAGRMPCFSHLKKECAEAHSHFEFFYNSSGSTCFPSLQILSRS